MRPRDRLRLVAADLVRLDAAGLLEAPHPVDRRADAHAKLRRRLMPRQAALITARPPAHEGPSNRLVPSMLASFPASMLNQNLPDLGILDRFKLKPSRSSLSLFPPVARLGATIHGFLENCDYWRRQRRFYPHAGARYPLRPRASRGRVRPDRHQRSQSNDDPQDFGPDRRRQQVANSHHRHDRPPGSPGGRPLHHQFRADWRSRSLRRRHSHTTEIWC